MRSEVVLISLLVGVVPAPAHQRLAAPKPLPESRLSLDLGNLHFHLFHEPGSEAADASAAAGSAGSNWSQEKALPNLSVGPLHAKFGADDDPRAGLSSYKLQGGDQLGSSLWHDEQGRSAKLLFVWPTGR
jgi:hypothetical protein